MRDHRPERRSSPDQISIGIKGQTDNVTEESTRVSLPGWRSGMRHFEGMDDEGQAREMERWSGGLHKYSWLMSHTGRTNLLQASIHSHQVQELNKSISYNWTPLDGLKTNTHEPHLHQVGWLKTDPQTKSSSHRSETPRRWGRRSSPHHLKFEIDDPKRFERLNEVEKQIERLDDAYQPNHDWVAFDEEEQWTRSWSKGEHRWDRLEKRTSPIVDIERYVCS